MTEKRLGALSHLPLTALAGVTRAVPEVDFTAIPRKGELPPGVAGEVLLTFPRDPGNLRAALACGVRWVHTLGTGVDRFPFEWLGDRTLTCSRGASAVPIAEWILAVMLAFEKHLPDAWIEEPPERWSMAELGSLHGKTVALVGLGGIGVAVAERVLPFGARVRALRRTSAASPLPQVTCAPNLEDLLASADHIVLAAPATAETRHLIDRRSLGWVKPGVHLVNISRGSLVDEEALREALDDGRVACASLDVAELEPLPSGHWLYQHKKVRVSPHVSWSMPGAIERLLDSFTLNLQRYLRGEPLCGRVDPELGY
jgi:phosphoglycerate dehydrogenase-like enzyme